MRASSIALAVLVVTVGCGEVIPRSPDGGDDATGSPAFALGVSNPGASVPIGGMNRVIVQITRTGGFTGAVTIAGVSPPPGLTIIGGAIAGSEGEVLVSGAPPLAIGATVSFTLEATGDGVAPQTATLTNAPVTGRPGSLDASFGPGGTGLATLSLGADDSGGFRALDVIAGSVLAVGDGTGGLGATRFIAMRFTPAGAVDPTWNGGAVVRTSFGTSSNDTALAYATGQQNDGRSIAIGEHRSPGADIALARYSRTGGNGGVDFGDGTGKAVVNLGGTESVTDGLVLPSNQIIAVGKADNHFMIARMTSAGLLDTTFNTIGYVRSILGASSQATAVALDSQDRVLVVGDFDAGGQRDLVLRRYTAGGAIDGAFGPNGVLIDGPDSETAINLVTLGDKIFVAAVATTTTGKKLRVRRFLATGAIDTSFGAQGLAEATVSADTVGRDLAVLPDGRVLVLADVAGTALLLRFTAAGALDTLFGTAGDGTATLNIGDHGKPAALAIYSDHLVVIGGGNQGGVPGPGTFAIVARMWM